MHVAPFWHGEDWQFKVDIWQKVPKNPGKHKQLKEVDDDEVSTQDAPFKHEFDEQAFVVVVVGEVETKVVLLLLLIAVVDEVDDIVVVVVVVVADVVVVWPNF